MDYISYHHWANKKIQSGQHNHALLWYVPSPGQLLILMMQDCLSYTLLQPTTSRQLMTRNGSIGLSRQCCPVFHQTHWFADCMELLRTMIDWQRCGISRSSVTSLVFMVEFNPDAAFYKGLDYLWFLVTLVYTYHSDTCELLLYGLQIFPSCHWQAVVCIGYLSSIACATHNHCHFLYILQWQVVFHHPFDSCAFWHVMTCACISCRPSQVATAWWSLIRRAFLL